MIQANKYKIEKLFFSEKKKEKCVSYHSRVNGNKRPTVINPVGSLMLTCWEAEEQTRGVFIQTFINFHHLYTAEQRQRGKRRCEDCESLYTSRTEGHVQRHTSSLLLLSVNGCYSGLRMFLCRFGCLCFLIQSSKRWQWQCFRCQERHIIIIHHVFSHFSSCYIILLCDVFVCHFCRRLEKCKRCCYIVIWWQW